jgi:hypothetical protein
MRRVLLAAAAALLAAPALAIDESTFLVPTGKELGELCAATEDPSAIHFCHGFIVGVHRLQLEVAKATGVAVYCIPENATVTRKSAAADFSAWVAGNAEAAAMPALDAFFTWAKTVAPCP